MPELGRLPPPVLLTEGAGETLLRVNHRLTEKQRTALRRYAAFHGLSFAAALERIVAGALQPWRELDIG